MLPTDCLSGCAGGHKSKDARNNERLPVFSLMDASTHYPLVHLGASCRLALAEAQQGSLSLHLPSQHPRQHPPSWPYLQLLVLLLPVPGHVVIWKGLSGDESAWLHLCMVSLCAHRREITGASKAALQVGFSRGAAGQPQPPRLQPASPKRPSRQPWLRGRPAALREERSDVSDS